MYIFLLLATIISFVFLSPSFFIDNIVVSHQWPPSSDQVYYGKTFHIRTVKKTLYMLNWNIYGPFQFINTNSKKLDLIQIALCRQRYYYFRLRCSVLYIFVCPCVLFRLVIVLSVLLRFMAFRYRFSILDLWLLVTLLVS